MNKAVQCEQTDRDVKKKNHFIQHIAETVRFCDKCDGINSMTQGGLRCFQCKNRYYCSRECSLLDLDRHQNECSFMKFCGDWGPYVAKLNNSKAN